MKQTALWKTELGRSAVHAGRWAISARLVSGLGRLVRSLVLARLLAPADFGLAALALIAIETLDTCTAPGLESALIQRTDEATADIDQAFTIQLIRAAIVGLAGWLTAGLVQSWFDTPRLATVIRWMALLPLLRGLSNPGTVELVRHLRFKRVFAWETADVVTAVTTGIAVALVRPDVTALVASVLAGQGVRTLVSWVIVPHRARPRLDPNRALGLLRFGGWVLVANVLMLLNVEGEHLLVGALFGPSALGIYQMGSRIASLPVTLLGHPVVQVAFPALTKLRADTHRFNSLYWSVAAGLILASAVWLLLMGPLANIAVGLVLGDGWLASVPILRIMLVSTVLRVLVIFGQAGFYALGRPDLHVRVNAIRLLGAAALIPILTPTLGLPGVAISVLGGTGAAALAQVWLLRRVAPGRAGGL